MLNSDATALGLCVLSLDVRGLTATAVINTSGPKCMCVCVGVTLSAYAAFTHPPPHTHTLANRHTMAAFLKMRLYVFFATMKLANVKKVRILESSAREVKLC